MRTYTAHKLTDAQLRRLSRIANNGKGAKGGVAADALVRKGLVRELFETHVYPRAFGPSDVPYERQVFVGREATDEGRAALAQARHEGW